MSELRKKLAEAAEKNLDGLLKDVFGSATLILSNSAVSATDVFKLLSCKRTNSIRAKVIAAMVKRDEALLIRRWQESQAQIPLTVIESRKSKA